MFIWWTQRSGLILDATFDAANQGMHRIVYQTDVQKNEQTHLDQINQLISY